MINTKSIEEEKALTAYREVCLRLAYYAHRHGEISYADQVRLFRIANFGGFDNESNAIGELAKEIGEYFLA